MSQPATTTPQRSPEQRSPEQRRSQEQRSAQMRTRLLDATIECLVEYGYAGTTSQRIAEASGVTRGAQIHHFGSKDELVLAAIHHLAAKRTEEAVTEAAAIDFSVDPFSALMDLLWDIHDGPLFTATVELWVASRTNPQLAGEMARFETLVTTTLRSVVGRTVPASLHKEFIDLVYTAMDVLRGIRISSFVDSDPTRCRRRWDRAAANLRRIATPAIEQLQAEHDAEHSGPVPANDRSPRR